MTPENASRSCSRLAPLFLVGLASIVLAFPIVARAQVWNEVGDAGDLVATAQVTVGTGMLTQINGALDTPTDVDLYCVHLAPGPRPLGVPLVQLSCVVIQGPNVFLFDAAGNGIALNETCSAGDKTLTDLVVQLPAGTYYVGIANYGIVPLSAGGPMWQVGISGQRAPDGPGAAGPLVGWGGTPIMNPINPYTVMLQSSYTGYCSSATPVTSPTWGAMKSIYR